MSYFNCVIPVRGNSSEVKNKNFKKVGKYSLIERNILTLKKCNVVKNIIISSEDDRFEKIAKKHNIFFIKRPKNLSNNYIMPDHAVKHALDIFYKENQYSKYSGFTQCTSPFLNSDDVKRSLKKIVSNNFDSLFTSYNCNKFIWRFNLKKNNMRAINHRKKYRLGRQYIKQKDVIENGALYIFNTKKFLIKSHRFFGSVGTFQMPEIRSIDINTNNDFKLANSLIKFISE